MVNFTLPGGTVVDQYNSLGFALMFLWLIVFFPVFFLYHDSELIIRFEDFKDYSKNCKYNFL